MSKLIRRIIKESIDEFDWVDTDTSQLSGQRLFDTIQEFLQSETNGKYWLEREEDMIMFWDESGIYLDIGELDFSIDGIKSELEATIKHIENAYGEKKVPIANEMYTEYIDLAKVLEPIIGPINFSINESEEFDWVDVSTSNLAGQNLYEMIQELFNLNNSMYQIKRFGSGIIEISDDLSIYLEYVTEDFTVNRVREDLSNIINDYNIGPSVRMDYSNLARTLAPIIGPMEYYH